MTADTALDAHSDKARQEAEARARDPGTRGDFRPADEAPADPAADLSAPEAGEELSRREPEAPDGAPAPQPHKPAPGPFDLKRAEMAARFRSHRSETDQEAAGDAVQITALTHAGLPLELVQERVTALEPIPEAASEPVPQQQPALPAESRRVTLLVRGQEQEFTEEEVRALAQKAAAGGDYLADARKTFDSAKALADEIQATRSAVAGTQAQQTNGDQPTAAEHPGDPYREVLEAIQFEDPAVAAGKLRQLIKAEASQQSEESLERTRLADENARSQKILRDFMDRHPDLANDPMASAAIEREIHRLQAADLAALGVPLEQLPDRGIGGLEDAHLWYRTKGFRVHSAQDLLTTARDNFLKWKAAGKPERKDPGNESAGRGQQIVVAVDRQERRAAIPQQPARSAAPRPQPEGQGNGPDRTAVVQAMMRQRAKPRGKVIQ
ncbi:MAG: hypothetical protein ACLPKB_24740 [Xanthobacteraceae bacterium]